jgi:release factor glutamine methyltransferase
MQEAFARKDLDSPRLLAEMLMAHVVGCDRLKLYLDPDRPASPLERDTLRNLVARALKHEPVQYLVGEAWFFGLPFQVDPRVLIPRPATETIVEEVLQNLRARHAPAAAKGEGVLIADVCTGSGCIAIALLKNLPGARVVASDISGGERGALDVARANAIRHGVLDRLDLLAGDLLVPLLDYPSTRGVASLDYLVSNPPYIPDDEWGAVAPNVKDHEPHLALRGGADGLDYVRRLLADSPRLIKPGGLMLVEVADSRAEQARALMAASTELADIRVLKDFEGLQRVVLGRRV